MINATAPRFCPRKRCPYYQAADNPITKDGTYTTRTDATPRQAFYCTKGKHRFSETAYADLFRKHGSFKEYTQTAKLTQYGLATEAIADVLEKDPRTIQHWQDAIGAKSRQFHLFLCMAVGISLMALQMDELWSYLRKKVQQLWIFIAFEPHTKFWFNFTVGPRTNASASRLLIGLKKLVHIRDNQRVRVTTDKLAAYRHALTKHFPAQSYVYLQIVKKRWHRRLVTVKKCFIQGTAEDFPEKTQNTSYIERFNLTLRHSISSLQRKTLGYCKSKTHLETSLWIKLFDYNYCRFHKGLRITLSQECGKFRQKYQHCTPAMRIGLTHGALTWVYLFTFPIPDKYVK